VARQAARLEARVAIAAHPGVKIGPDDRVLLQVGRLEPRKGVLELANAFLNRSDRHGARLMFVGSGSLEGALRHRASTSDGALVVVGEADMDTVRRYLRAADVFVLNTFQDPNPLTPIEASFSELPVVLSARAGNVEEIVLHGRTGARIEDPKKPDDGLDWALNSTNADLGRAGQAALDRVNRTFSRKAAATEFITSVLDFITKRRSK
jgi:glycosyltransferase involved in cell wall biosynthesis